MTKRFRPYLVVAAAFLGLARPETAKAQAPLFFDGFLADNGGMPANDFNLFFLWTVTNGSVDLAGGTVPGVDDPAMGGRFVDLAGSSGDPGEFTTRSSLLFLAGMTYNLSFRYANTGGTMNQATATIGSQTFNITTSSPAFVMFSQDFSFGTDTAAVLSFQDLGLGADNFGVGIDTVQILQVVPEPSSYALLAGAAIVWGLARQRKRTSARLR